MERIRDFRRALRQGRRPWPLRPLMWWLAFNLSGKKRSRLIGTFGLTTLGSLGVGVTRILTPLTSNLYFGVFDDRGRVDVRLAFDHRVLDGGTAARALADLETVLTHETLAELYRPTVGLTG